MRMTKMTITKTDRNVFIGCHVTEAAKAATKAEAKKQHVSMSQWVSIAILEKLERAEVRIEDYDVL
jgi:hypothetical protein